nr:unnamed protein product [Digitaria exilis]
MEAAAVVSSTEGVLRILLGKLGAVLAEKYVLLSSVGREIQELKEDLEIMNACLHDLAAGSEYHHSEQTRTWMKQVREVAYDAEDSIDIFWYHNSHRHCNHNLIVGWLCKIIRPLKTLRAMYNLAIEIRDLKERAMKVSERRLRYRVEAASGGASDAYAAARSSLDYNHLERQLPALNINEWQLVGITEKTKSAIKLLEDGNLARLKVVPIVGFGGLGKTTLAVNVYKSTEMKGIQTRAFLAVSQHYDLRILLESLLRQLIRVSLRDPSCSVEEPIKDPLRGIETWHISELIGRCRTHLEDKSNEDLKDICKMSLLRYLCLRRTNVSQLPKQVGALKELVTLDIRETSIRELPDTVTELGNLKHLLGGRLKQLIVDNAPNLDELRFDGGAPNLEMLTLAFEREPAKGTSAEVLIEYNLFS